MTGTTVTTARNSPAPAAPDMCVPCGDGYLNIRVGAVIMKDGKILMAGNERNEYLYSVGGRIKFGETAEEAVRREVREETGRDLEIDRLGFVHETYFPGDTPSKMGRPIYEISFYFYMKTPPDFEPVCDSFSEECGREFLRWIDPEGDEKYFPEFFRTELAHPAQTVKHFVSDDRR
ncbi:MAG: NUDIX domain-containing protein [Lachnospiraceae bacterium]|nr:NUDIX domain-containing protein [Lachnospiraceae bacterium]